MDTAPRWRTVDPSPAAALPEASVAERHSLCSRLVQARSSPLNNPILSFELPSDEAAKARAQEIADRTGKEVVVKDAVGRELFRAHPIPRNEIAIRPETSS